MRFEVYVFHHHEIAGSISAQLGDIMFTLAELNTKMDGLTVDLSDLSTAVDAFIASDVANFAALQAALAGGDQAAIDAAVAKIDAARATLVAKKDAVTAADAADNLPVAP
jgi:hypothetical protein